MPNQGADGNIGGIGCIPAYNAIWTLVTTQTIRSKSHALGFMLGGSCFLLTKDT